MSEQAAAINCWQLLNCSSEILFVLDKEFSFLFLNQTTERLLGFCTTELTGKNFMVLVADEQKEDVQAKLTGNQKEKKSFELEISLQSKDGSLLDFILTASVQCDSTMYCSLRNISESKIIEQKLVASQQKFKNLFLNSSDIVVVIDEGGKFKYASHSANSILGFVAEDFQDKNVFEFVHPDDMERVLTDFYRAIIKKEPDIVCEHRFRSSNGEWIWLETKATDMLRDKNVEGIVISSRNISERKKLQAQLDGEIENRRKEVTLAVMKAQEEERTQLSLELHDNVNQVLGTVKLYCELLRKGENMGKDLLVSSIELINYSINEIRRITKRLSVPSLEEVSLEKSIQNLIDSIVLTRQIEIVFQVEGLESCTVTNELHLTIYRIIQEQLNNILKYAKAKTVFIRLDNTVNALQLFIEDDGIGFNPKEKRAGIGIMNMKTRAEAENGKLSIWADDGVGCKLKVAFPPLHSALLVTTAHAS